MTYKEISDFVANIKVFKSKKAIYLKNHFPCVYNEILEKTKFLDDTNLKNIDISFQERMYCINHNITSRPVCKECNNQYVYFRKDECKYRDFCSLRCSRHSDLSKSKRENTCLNKYGVKHYINIDKARKTREEKNGGSWSSKDFVDKVKATNLRLHGMENWNNQNKSKKTCMDRYGVESPFASKQIRDKCKLSFMKNHPGMKSTMDIPEIRMKVFRGIRLRSWRYILNNSFVEPMFSEDDYLSCSDVSNKKFPFKCKKCGNVFESVWDNGNATLCDKCYPGLRGTSESEIELSSYIKSIIPHSWNVYNKDSFNRSIIPPKEIDIVVCDDSDNVKLLIEYDGLFFHSDSKFSNKNKEYHLNKTELCEEKGFQLIHVFENEWLTKRDIVCSRIKNLLGMHDVCIYARQCNVREITDDECRMFLVTNHNQGDCVSKVRIGLFFKNELVSVMTFGKPRFNKKYDWELLRFCNKLNHKVIGGAGKLLKCFERNYCPKYLLSYADRRWSVGKLYVSLGFELIGKSKPNYWYFKPNNPYVLFNRVKFQKSKLKDVLDIYDEKLSESENMSKNGFLRIYDCGNLVYLKEYKKTSI